MKSKWKLVRNYKGITKLTKKSLIALVEKSIIINHISNSWNYCHIKKHLIWQKSILSDEKGSYIKNLQQKILKMGSVNTLNTIYLIYTIWVMYPRFLKSYSVVICKIPSDHAYIWKYKDLFIWGTIQALLHETCAWTIN